MKLSRILLAVAIATVLSAAYAAPAAAAGSANLLGGTCSPALYSPAASAGSITLVAEMQCWSSIDFAYINMQLRRIEGGFDNGVPGSNATCMTTTSWYLSCVSSVPCQTGYYYGRAEFSASSTSGYSESETYSTPVRLITC
jgi:hypothetical protein